MISKAKHITSDAMGAMQVKMVTGDQRLIAIETCRRLGMGTNIMEGSELMSGKAGAMDLATKVTEVDGFAGVYPEHKHRIVSALQSKGRLVGMTGVPPLLHGVGRFPDIPGMCQGCILEGSHSYLRCRHKLHCQGGFVLTCAAQNEDCSRNTMVHIVL